jgi:hypothetical protein
MCAFISLIYFKTIVIDTLISFRKWEDLNSLKIHCDYLVRAWDSLSSSKRLARLTLLRSLKSSNTKTNMQLEFIKLQISSFQAKHKTSSCKLSQPCKLLLLLSCTHSIQTYIKSTFENFHNFTISSKKNYKYI